MDPFFVYRGRVIFFQLVEKYIVGDAVNKHILAHDQKKIEFSILDVHGQCMFFRQYNGLSGYCPIHIVVYSLLRK